MAVFTASVHGLGGTHYSPVQLAAWAPRPPDPEVWRERLSTMETIVREGRRGLAGFLSYRPDGMIELLYTHPDHARHGVATALYRVAEMRLVGLGVNRFETRASRVARPFFEQHGFRVDMEETVAVQGIVFSRYVMSRDLSGNPL